ncbi:MAG: PAS domain-containing protein [Planctomycetota bacterium]
MESSSSPHADAKAGFQHLLPLLEQADGLMTWDTAWRCAEVNPRAAALHGLDPDALRGAQLADVLPDPHGPLRRTLERAAQLGQRVEAVVFLPAQERYVRLRAFPHAAGVTALYQDVGSGAHESRVLQGLVEVLELDAQGAPLARTLEAVVRLVEDLAPDTLGSILLLDDDGVRIRHGAAPSLPAAYSAAIEGAPVGPSTGSCGTAAYTRCPVIVSDIASDPLWADYRDLALSHGLRACWSFPILDRRGEVLGTFALYRDRPSTPEPSVLDLIDQATHAARVAIEHARQRAAAQEQDFLLREMSRLAKVGGWGFDPASGRGAWTEETARIHDLPPDAEANVEIGLEHFQGEHRQAIERAVQRAIEHAEPYDLELELVSGAGNRKWVRTIGRPVLEDERVVSVHGVIQDITARRHAQDAARQHAANLEQTRQLLQEVFDTTFDEVFVLERVDGRWIHSLLNARAEAATGLPLARMRGLTPLEAYGPEFGARVQRNLETCWEIQAPLHLVEHVPRAGGARWFETVYSPSPGPDGAGRIMVFAHDISERKQAQDELRQTLVSLQQAVSAGQVGLYDWDLRTNRVHYSKEWKQQIGYLEHEIADEYSEWEQRLHPEDRGPTQALIQAYLAGDDPDFECEFRFRHKDGTYRHILARGTSLRDERGQRARVVGSHVDLSELIELKSQFLQAQKMEILGRLAGGVAHDFNNLLTAILGYSDLTLRRLAADDAARGGVEEIHKAGQRAAALTRQLLSFSRRQVLQLRVLNVNGLVEDMSKLLHRLLGEDVTLTVSLGAGLPCVKVDPSQLEQVVLNLCINARDAMPEGGELEVFTRKGELSAPGQPSHPAVVLAVRDHGAGIPPEVLPHVFEPFYTTKEVDKGTGLGLSTVHGIVQDAGGQVRVDTEPGRGTTFEVYLPAAAADPAEAVAAQAPQPASGSGTILLADDDTGVRALCLEVLRSGGYQVLAAAHGKAALLEAERAAKVDLLLTDVVMPGLNGAALARQLRQRFPRLPVLFLSGYSPAELAQVPRSSFLAKPFTPAALLERVRDALQEVRGAPPSSGA